MVWSEKRTKVRINFIASSSEITVLQCSLNDFEMQLHLTILHLTILQLTILQLAISQLTILQLTILQLTILQLTILQFKLKIKCKKNCNPDNFNYRMKYKSDLNSI
jgi:hypothetical protein